VRIHVLDSKLVPLFDLRRDGDEFYWTPKEVYKMNDDIPTTNKIEALEQPDVDYPYFKCGICKTEFSMPDVELFLQAVARHSCQVGKTPWFSHMFSLWGFLVVAIICYTVVEIVR